VTERTREIIELPVKDLAFDGKSVGDLDGKIVFLNGGLPGERVRAEIIRKKSRYNIARVVEIIERSPERIEPRCRHFGECGGCTWQDLDYERQLFYKRKQVVDCLEHIGRLNNIEVTEPLGAPEQFHYRNKMEFSFNTAPDNNFTLGLHKRGHFDEIFDLTECRLTSVTAVKIVAWFREFVRENGIPAYDVTNHTGFLRFLMIREAKNTGQIMINIVTTNGTIPKEDELIARVRQNFPEVTTIVHNINNQKSNIAKGETETVLSGDGYIEEKILGRIFRIYANSFFQTNSGQTENLYRTAIEFLNPSPNDRLLDLYCGSGTIGICASGHLEKVIGVELEPAAIEAARENALANNIDNIEFHIGSAQKLMPASPEIFKHLTCAVVDPPRAGIHKKALIKLAEFGYPRLVYISCNPSTFARDASFLVNSEYILRKVIPVDMFPHTMHIELVSLFEKKIGA